MIVISQPGNGGFCWRQWEGRPEIGSDTGGGTRVLHGKVLDVKVDLALCIQNVFGYLCGDIDINR